MGKSSSEMSLREKLSRLEDKRLLFARRIKGEGFDPEFSLYIQREGGFWGLAQNGDEHCVLFGPGPGEDADFWVERFPHGALTVGMLPVSTKSTGLGGAFGFGHKGGEGYKIVVLTPTGKRIEMTLLSQIGSYLETRKRDNALLFLERARGNANFVWQMRTGDAADVCAVCERWRALLSH